MYKIFFKIFLDKFLSIFLLLILIIPILIITVLLLFVNKGHFLFRQSRIGLNEEKIVVLKFKTMADVFDNEGHLLSDMNRVTRVGYFLRKTSLDELPQLVNVIKGDMSLVGPRPLLEEYLPLYSDYQRRRHEVKPGITGWAQVNGRNAISWQQKFDYDVWYVENTSFKLDIKILLLTIKKIVRSEDINSSENTTMEKFTGN